jgi:lysophospholipase L1-like esterase
MATLNQADGIHPNEDGSALVARTVWQALGPVLARVDQSAGSR